MIHQDDSIVSRSARGTSFRAVTALGLFATALLAACGGGQDSSSGDSGAPPVTRSLGLMEITVSGIGSAQMSSQAHLLGSGNSGGAQQAHVAQPTPVPNGLDVKQVSASYIDLGTPGSGTRYVTVVYAVRNAPDCVDSGGVAGSCTAYTTATSNLTLIAANTIVAGNIANTAITGMSLLDGTTPANAAAVALSLQPTHGMQFDSINRSGVVVQPGLESLQVFSEDEVGAIPRDTGATDLFPYGYVVSNPSTPNSRSLPASPVDNEYDGQVAFSFSLPLQGNPAQDPYTVKMIFQVVDDANTRVTESLQEDNAPGDIAAGARAALLGASDLAVLGGRVAQTNIGDPVCNVRLAGPSGGATASLVAQGSAAALGSAPYNLQNLDPAGAITAGFCVPMAAADANSFAVYGSQSGRHAGGYTGAGSNQLVYTPTNPFLPGETVSFSLAGSLAANDGASTLVTPFVGSFTLGGLTPSSGQVRSLYQSVRLGGASLVALASGDFNGDGRTDLVAADQGGDGVDILINNGGTFQAFPLSSGNGAVSVAVADLDGNGILDLAVANSSDQTVAILYGAGNGNFNLGPVLPMSAVPTAVLAADFNGDGNIDLAVATADGKVSLLLGDGSGDYTASASSPFTVGTAPVAMAAGDFNRDGKLDLAVANQADGTVSILLGDGAGGFTVSTVSVGTAPNSIAVADFNHDGKADLAVANEGDGTVSVLLGDGTGAFAAAPGSPVGIDSTAFGIAAGDFDGNGKPDLVVTSNGDSTVSVLLGNGDGTFADFAIAGPPGPTGVAVGDFDGDGKLDFAMASGGSGNVAVMLNNGFGGFGYGSNGTGARPSAVAAADFDGDGRPDAAVTDFADGTVMVLSNYGGAFSPSAQFYNVGQQPYAITSGDFDGDGQPDVATANFGDGSVTVLLNGGSAGFSTLNVPVGSDLGGIVAGDFNGDGRLDLAVTDLNGPPGAGPGSVVVLINNGLGGFNVQTPIAVGAGPVSLVVTDFNGDGRLDLAVANSGDGTISILPGDGMGGFASFTLPSVLLSGFPTALASGDFNGDGRPDLVVGYQSNPALTVLLNDGSGGFTPSTAPGVGYFQSAIQVADFDGDGKADLAVANEGDNTLTLLRGDGKGGFVPTGTVGVGNLPTGLAAANFDNSFRMSLVVVDSGDNLLQQLLQPY